MGWVISDSPLPPQRGGIKRMGLVDFFVFLLVLGVLEDLEDLEVLVILEPPL